MKLRSLKIALFASLLAFSTPVWAAFTYVQMAAAAANSGPIETVHSCGAMPANVTAGDTLVYFATYHSSGTAVTATMSDTLGNTYVQANSFFNTTDAIGIAWGYAANVTGGADTPQVTWSGSVDEDRCVVLEYSGVSTTTPFTTGQAVGQEQTFTGTPGTNAISSGTTPTLASEPTGIIAVTVDYNNGNTSTAGTGFTEILSSATDTNHWEIEDQALTSTAALAATFSSSAITVSHFYTAAIVLNEGVPTFTPRPVESGGHLLISNGKIVTGE